MAKPKKGERLRYSVSLVTQGKRRFHTLTIPSDILAKTCFVSTREEAQDIDGGPAGAIEDPEERGERLKREREDKIKAAKERYLARKKIKG